jgi:hypothetical protein
MDCISQMHPEVEWGWGVSLFWSEKIFIYDIIHFQWPQAFMAVDNKEHSLNSLSQRLKRIKQRGIKVVSTCHDLEPHYEQCAEYAGSFKIVYEQSDVFFHLGEYSKELFSNRYPNAKHFILPHHLYNTVYTNFPSEDEAKDTLHLNKKYTYILCLGMFRSNEERTFLLSTAKKFSHKKIAFLAPAFMIVPKRRLLKFFPTKEQLIRLYYQFRYKIFCTGKTWVPIPDEQIPYFYAASKIAFVHRLKILNSGNAVLPMLFKKIIVGPDIGNVGPLLKYWGYPTFDVNNPSSAQDAIKKGLVLATNENNSHKYIEQIKKYSTQTISEKLYSYYSSFVKKKDKSAV